LQVDSLLSAVIRLDVEGDLLAFLKATHAGLLDGADVHEDVFRPVFGSDEAEAPGRVKKLYGTDSHIFGSPILNCFPRTKASRRSE